MPVEVRKGNPLLTHIIASVILGCFKWSYTVISGALHSQHGLNTLSAHPHSFPHLWHCAQPSHSSEPQTPEVPSYTQGLLKVINYLLSRPIKSNPLFSKIVNTN